MTEANLRPKLFLKEEKRLFLRNADKCSTQSFCRRSEVHMLNILASTTNNDSKTERRTDRQRDRRRRREKHKKQQNEA